MMPPEWNTRSSMINAIGAMHATIRTKKRHESEAGPLVEVKKRRRAPIPAEADERRRREHAERGRIV